MLNHYFKLEDYILLKRVNKRQYINLITLTLFLYTLKILNTYLILFFIIFLINKFVLYQYLIYFIKIVLMFLLLFHFSHITFLYFLNFLKLNYKLLYTTVWVYKQYNEAIEFLIINFFKIAIIHNIIFSNCYHTYFSVFIHLLILS